MREKDASTQNCEGTAGEGEICRPNFACTSLHLVLPLSRQSRRREYPWTPELTVPFNGAWVPLVDAEKAPGAVRLLPNLSQQMALLHWRQQRAVQEERDSDGTPRDPARAHDPERRAT